MPKGVLSSGVTRIFNKSQNCILFLLRKDQNKVDVGTRKGVAIARLAHNFWYIQ